LGKLSDCIYYYIIHKHTGVLGFWGFGVLGKSEGNFNARSKKNEKKAELRADAIEKGMFKKWNFDQLKIN